VTALYPTAEANMDPGSSAEAAATAGDELAALRDENAELRTLLAIQHELGHGPTPKEVLQEVLGQIHVALGCARSCALLQEGFGGHFEPAATVGLSDEAVSILKASVAGPESIPALGRAIAVPGLLVLSPDEARGLLPPALVPVLAQGALLPLPIRGLGAEIIGLLLLDFALLPDGSSPLTPARLRLAGAVAGRLSLLLENAVLYEQLRRRTMRLEALNEIGLALVAAASSDPAALFARLQPQMADVVRGACFLAILDEAKGQGRPGTAMTVWGGHEDTPIDTFADISLGADCLSVAIRGGRRVHYANPEAFGGAPALPPALLARFSTGQIGSAVYLPLRLRRRTFGALIAIGTAPRAFSNEQIEFLTTVAAQMAVTIEHGRLYGVLRAKGEMRRRLLDQTMQAQEAERKALVGGVLDGALQELASYTYRLDLGIRLSELGKHERCREELRETRQQLSARIEDLRTMIGSLRPSNLDILGLQSVLRDELTAFQAQTGIRATFLGRFKGRLTAPIETRAYRIAQELLTNVRRHSNAKTVNVELRNLGDDVLLSVTDDGDGFDTAAALQRDAGMGLHGIREGAEILGGDVHVQSRPGTGTRVEIIFPRILREQGEGEAVR